jgi:hypothetical protein
MTVLFAREWLKRKRFERVQMGKDEVKEIEDKIADLKARWPAHSVPPSMWQELEALEEELEKAREAQKED